MENEKYFNKALELGSTKAFIFGHDHINNLVLNYKGINLCYGLKSGRTSYYNNEMLGGNLYTITLERVNFIGTLLPALITYRVVYFIIGLFWTRKFKCAAGTFT